MRWLCLTLVLASASALAAGAASLAPRRPTDWWADRRSGAAERMRGAEARRGGGVREMFARAGVAFPPRQLLLRAFKQERELEVWASGEAAGGGGQAPALRLVATYEICAASGELGPKRREGDLQVPEGFYRIALFNPQSAYHLSMRVDYPNASDRVLSDRERPGGDIMIHGSCASVGCLAMSDERIEELWLMARAAPGPVQVHLLPARDIDALLSAGHHPAHEALWRNLKEGLDWFERHRRLPAVQVDARGRYLVGD